LASIDAFWELAASQPAPKQVLRISLQHLRPAANHAADRATTKQRTLILIGIALLHVLMLLVLRAAMQPPKFAHVHETAPMQITFIERQPALVIPTPIIAPPVIPQPRATPTPQRFVPRADALQAVTIAPRSVSTPAIAEPPKALLYSKDSTLLVPAAPASNPPRDLLAHRSVDWMLPGAARKDSPDFHVRDDPSPQDAVNKVAGIVGGLIGGVAARPDQNGVVMSAPDRGMRTSGRDSDPCDDIALDTADLNASAKEREQASERYERNCQGH